ncbi:hypothetical protein TNCV_3355041 [Trichonephila clavipes]|nr:hypothetical protein TNCV_3355041 [Trichonephila clavipes]
MDPNHRLLIKNNTLHFPQTDPIVRFAIFLHMAIPEAKRNRISNPPDRAGEGKVQKEGRFVRDTLRSKRMRVLYRSRQIDRLRVMLVLVHIDITSPHIPLPVLR